MKTPKKETKEVINEAVKEVTGKSIEEKKAELIAEMEKQNSKDEMDCLKEVNQALEKYKCSLVESVRFVRGHNQPFFETKIIKNKG